MELAFSSQLCVDCEHSLPNLHGEKQDTSEALRKFSLDVKRLTDWTKREKVFSARVQHYAVGTETGHPAVACNATYERATDPHERAGGDQSAHYSGLPFGVFLAALVRSLLLLPASGVLRRV